MSERQERAADRVEELAMAMKEAVILLRQGQSDTKAYALVYVLRRELGYVVNALGDVGVPTAEDTRWAKEHIDAAIGNADE